VNGFESNAKGRAQAKRRWFLPGLCVVLGLYYLADFLHGGGVHRVVFGIGFLMLAPSVFLNPVPLSTPVATAFKQQRKPSKWDWVAIAGTFVLIAGLVLAWTVDRG